MSTNKKSNNINSEYAIELSYRKGSENPSHVFKAMSELIDSFQEIDENLAKSISVDIETKAILEEIEIGSLRARLSTILKSIDDAGLKKLEWKEIVGSYLVKGKKKIIEFLDKSPTNIDQKKITGLESELLQLAQDTDVRQIPVYAPIPRRNLLLSLKQLSASVVFLEEGDTAKLMVGSESVVINKDFKLSEEIIEPLLVRETIESTSEMILKVKKPDLLGHSMWEFKYKNKTIQAKLTDISWLEKFHLRKVIIKPGDSMRAIVNISEHYDQNNDVIDTEYTITLVKEIIPMPLWEQIDMNTGGEITEE